MGKRKEEDDTFLRKRTEEKQNNVAIKTKVDGKETVFPVELKHFKVFE